MVCLKVCTTFLQLCLTRNDMGLFRVFDSIRQNIFLNSSDVNWGSLSEIIFYGNFQCANIVLQLFVAVVTFIGITSSYFEYSSTAHEPLKEVCEINMQSLSQS